MSAVRGIRHLRCAGLRGSLLNSDTLTNTFDAANRLIETERAGTTLEPIYNGVNDRVGQTTSVTTTYFALDVMGLPEVIYTTEDNLYLHLPGVIMAESGTGEIRYLLSDGLGSVRQATDESGEVVAYNEFDPYGNPVQDDSSPYGFTGEWWETDIGLLHLRARWYAPETGTFLSVDPVESEPPYLYVGGNPTNLVDQSGTNPLCIPLVLVDGPLPIGDGICVVLIGATLWAGYVATVGPPQVDTPDISQPGTRPTYPPNQPIPGPAPAPPVPETQTGTGEDPFTLPTIYQAQPGGTPEPKPTATPIPIPYNRRPRPTATCTRTPDPDERRLIDIGPGFEFGYQTSFELLYDKYVDNYDKFVGVESDEAAFRLAQMSLSSHPRYDPTKIEHIDDFSKIPNQYGDFIFAMSPGPKFSKQIVSNWDKIAKPGAFVYFIIDSVTELGYNGNIIKDLEKQSFTIIEHHGSDNLSNSNFLNLKGLHSTYVDGAGWWEAYRQK